MANYTIQDVAREAGVSPSSVSNLLNGRPERMKPETRNRIQNAIERMDYRPSRVARQLKTGQTSMIGLLVPTVANPFYGELAVAVEVAAHAAGMHVMLCNTLRDMGREQEFANNLVTFGVRGLITASALTTPPELDALAAKGVCIVAFDLLKQSDERMDRIDFVTLDNAGSTALAVRSLAALGHQKITYVTGPLGTRNREARAQGYRDEMRRLGLDWEQVLVGQPEIDTSRFGDTDLAGLGRRLARRIAALPDRPTAVIGMNDMLAIGLLAGFRDLGVAAPGDISVVGIDDINLASLITPSLSTIRQPFLPMAHAAMNFLRDRMGDPDQAGKELIFEPEFVQRASVAATQVEEE